MNTLSKIAIVFFPVSIVISVLASNPIPLLASIVWLCSSVSKSEQDKPVSASPYTTLTGAWEEQGTGLEVEDKGRWCCAETDWREDGGEWSVMVKDKNISNQNQKQNEIQLEINDL